MNKKQKGNDSMKNMLDKKFRHSAWYKGSDLTWKDFLELAAENYNFYLSKKMSKSQSANLLDDINYDVVLRDEQGRGCIRLTEKQAEYYKRREFFWKQWEKNFENEYLIEDKIWDWDFRDYYFETMKEHKLKIPEYAEAVGKIKH